VLCRLIQLRCGSVPRAEVPQNKLCLPLPGILSAIGCCLSTAQLGIFGISCSFNFGQLSARFTEVLRAFVLGTGVAFVLSVRHADSELLDEGLYYFHCVGLKNPFFVVCVILI